MNIRLKENTLLERKRWRQHCIKYHSTWPIIPMICYFSIWWCIHGCPSQYLYPIHSYYFYVRHSSWEILVFWPCLYVCMYVWMDGCMYLSIFVCWYFGMFLCIRLCLVGVSDQRIDWMWGEEGDHKRTIINKMRESKINKFESSITFTN